MKQLNEGPGVLRATDSLKGAEVWVRQEDGANGTDGGSSRLSVLQLGAEHCGITVSARGWTSKSRTGVRHVVCLSLHAFAFADQGALPSLSCLCVKSILPSP